MSIEELHGKWAVILCGGRGERMGTITDALPKPLVTVHGKPILWYTIDVLYAHGFRNFIFPLGYKGKMIRQYVTDHFCADDCKLVFRDTGNDTPIAGRIHKILDVIPDKDDFFLLNGDTLFNFDIVEMYRRHSQEKAYLTLSSVEHISSFGMVVMKDGAVVDFVRNARIASLQMSDPGSGPAFVNAGMVWMNKDATSLVDLRSCRSFEEDVYPVIIATGRVAHFKINGTWYAVDTPKDLNAINSDPDLYCDIMLRLNHTDTRFPNPPQYAEPPEGA